MLCGFVSRRENLNLVRVQEPKTSSPSILMSRKTPVKAEMVEECSKLYLWAEPLILGGDQCVINKHHLYFSPRWNETEFTV